METLIIGHGKKHHKLNMDYDKTYFIDKDSFCEPDYIFDFSKNKIEIKVKFEKIMFINSARMILQTYDSNKGQEILLELPIQNILYLLKPNGYLYTTNVYSMPKNIGKRNENFIRDILAFGFEFIQEIKIEIKFNFPSSKMFVFKKIV